MSADALEQVPHLTTALSGPLHALERYLLDEQVKIEAWLRRQWRETSPPVYASVDLRNAGFKLAPIDTNLFPAGFNNLNADFMPLCVQAAQAMLEEISPGCTRVLLVPENHTRNMFYFESIATLQDILLKAGYAVRIASLIEDLREPLEVNLPSQRKITLEPLVRENDRVGVKDFSACVVLLNNDLSSGIPEILQNIRQKIFPPLTLGWSNRLKSDHFDYYNQVVEEFSKLIDIDPWLINPLFRRCNKINFLKREGEEHLAEHTEELLTAIQKKYTQYHIKEKPFVVVKADAGTYGMGVITIFDPAEIAQLNRKKRTQMSMAKGNREITQVIIQEGVYTFETWQDSVAEPVVYMMGRHVIGGFYRLHADRGVTENLNAPGMQFAPLAFAKPCNMPQQDDEPMACSNRFYSYGVIARLALVAAAREQKAAQEMSS